MEGLYDSLISDILSVASMSAGHATIEVLFGIVIFITVLALISPFFANILMNDPQNPVKIALFTRVFPGQVKAKMRTGRFIRLMRDKGPYAEFGWLWFLNPWRWYELYVWLFGLRIPGIPYIQTILTYQLPRFEKREEVDESTRREVARYYTKDDRSDHVRVRPFTFFFLLSGAEIQSVPFTVKGSIQARIKPGEDYDEKAPEFKAFFNTDSWVNLLNQALMANIRGVVRSELTLDDVIGRTQKGLWDDDPTSPDSYGKVSGKVLEGMKKHAFETEEGKLTLVELASIEVLSVEITDFETEVDDDEQKDIRAGIRGRQTGRGRALQGEGEAAFQRNVLEVATAHGDHGHTSMNAEAIVRASEGGKLDALAAALLGKIIRR